MTFRFSLPGSSTRNVPSGSGRPSPVPQRRQNQGAIKARSYGYRSGAVPMATGDDPGITSPLPLRGQQSDAINDPRSMRVIDSDAFSPGRAFMGRTEDALNTGRPPNRIDRGTTARNAGRIGVGGFPAGIGGWPYDGNAMFIPHQTIPRRPITVTPFQRTIDSGLTVSAAPIGGPIG